MESRLFYDIRPPEQPSGIFDLRRWPEGFREGLVTAGSRHLASLSPSSPSMQLIPQGYARIHEPSIGPNPQWTRLVIEVHKNLEIAVGQAIPVVYRIDRIYCFDFSVFTPQHWQLLADLFSQLPGWLGPEPYPRWFGDRGAPPPCMWGNFEPEGLHIRGMLSGGQWRGWDTWLRRNMVELPILK